VSKKAHKAEQRSCHYYLRSDAPPVTSRASQHINSRDEGLEREVVELLSGLDNAFSNATGEKPSDQVLRDQYVKALAAVCRFLLEIDPLHAERFLDLGQAIADLNRGARHPLLEKQTKAHPTPFVVSQGKNDVVFAMELLIAAGMSAREAAKDLLKRFPGIQNLAAPYSRRPNTKAAFETALLGWRRTLNADSRPKDADAARSLAFHRESIPVLAERVPPEALRQMAYDVAQEAEQLVQL
jgi:hypothetical protein